ncbi:MAG: hypothetical protein U0Q12_18115 [Vicinamibacterales bacterium]
MTVAILGIFVSVVTASASVAEPARLQPSTSAEPAASLVRLLDARQSDAIAAEDPDEPGRFVAALRFPSQLLVVTARCDGDAFLRHQVSQRAYRDVYSALHACAVPSTKFFVQDMGADGLHANVTRDAVPDVVYELATRQIILDGDWRKHELDRAGYASVSEKLDARYARLLTILLGQLERSHGPGGADR